MKDFKVKVADGDFKKVRASTCHVKQFDGTAVLFFYSDGQLISAFCEWQWVEREMPG